MENNGYFSAMIVDGIDCDKESMVFRCTESWGERKKKTFKIFGRHEIVGNLSNIIGQAIVKVSRYSKDEKWQYLGLWGDEGGSISVAGEFSIC